MSPGLGGRDAHCQIFHGPLSLERHMKEKNNWQPVKKNQKGVAKESKTVEIGLTRGRKRVLDADQRAREHLERSLNSQSNFHLSLQVQTGPLNALP